ncbi:MAG: 2-amino-4-hydroxy-6-hydroxymethyldihydropteridine diphosphokinase [Nitrospinae bacterium]|nr:2-amino-4-hydroxy-6-hydroxymethyldihydropteridine diphosphokinase [Nitrospinota bacterium]
MSKYPVFIGIGSNMVDAVDNCAKGIHEIGKIAENRIAAISSFYKTEPVGYLGQDWFVNCVIKIEANLTPHALLIDLQEIEKRFGRKRDIKWGPRIIDLDILLFDDLIINEKDLKIPHPRMQERRFVLDPLSEIAGNLVHPVIGKTVKELLKELNFSQKVELLEQREQTPHPSLSPEGRGLR